MTRTLQVWVGLVFFLGGGAILAFTGSTAGTAVGTVVGLAGLGLMVWAWAGHKPAE